MSERIQIQNHITGEVVADTEDRLQWATGLRFGSTAPGGYHTCSFQIRRRDVFSEWDVKAPYTVSVFRGGVEVWYGRIKNIEKSFQGLEQVATIEATGFKVFLVERLVRAFWWMEIRPDVDLDPLSGFDDSLDSVEWIYELRENRWILFGGTGDISRNDETGLEFVFATASELGYSQEIDYIEFDYRGRSGEGFSYLVYNVDQAANESSAAIISTGLEESGTITHTLTQGATSSIQIGLFPDVDDLYDQNDIVFLFNMVVKTLYQPGHPQRGSEAYNQDELIIDVILMINQIEGSQVISEDFDDVNAATDKELQSYSAPDPIPAQQIIADLLHYGGPNGETYNFFIWGPQGTSDGFARFAVSERRTDDWEYEIRFSDRQLRQFRDSLSDDQLYNMIIVKYIARETNVPIYWTWEDDSELKDNDSIRDEYPRPHILQVGRAGTTLASSLGTRFLDHHKDRKHKASFIVRGQIKKRDGGMQPVSMIRAGERVKVLPLDEVFYLGSVEIDAETQEARLTPDIAPDGINNILARINYELQLEAAQKQKERF